MCNEQKQVSLMALILTLALLGLAFTGFMNLFKSAQASENSLMNEQQILLISQQLGETGYKQAIKLECHSAIAVRLNTGKWNDNWCATHYKHLELN